MEDEGKEEGGGGTCTARGWGRAKAILHHPRNLSRCMWTNPPAVHQYARLLFSCSAAMVK